MTNPVDPYLWLAERGIPRGIAELADPQIVDIGLQFTLPTLDGEPFVQTLVREELRETAGGTLPKYQSPAGRVAVFRPVPRPDATRIAIVEGTKGHLAAAAYAPEDTEVWGLAGCQNWGRAGVPLPELAAVAGRDVVICFDGDLTRNADVWHAAHGLGDTLASMGALSVRWVYGILRGTASLDDYLATVAEPARAGVLTGYLASGKGTLGRAPARREKEPEPTERDIDADELTVAKAFAKQFGDQVRFDATTERWLVYASAWHTDGAGAAVKRMYHLLVDGIVRPMGTVTAPGGITIKREERRWSRSRSVRDAVLSMAGAEDPVTHFGDWDTDPYLFACHNGTLDLRTGTIRDSRPDDHITRLAGTGWDDDATCPEFERFLSEALPDADVRGYLQRVLGMALLGKVTDHVLPVLIGEGRNGKGTLLRVMLAAFGSYGTGVNRNLLIEQRNPGHLTELMTLKGKRLAVTQETNQRSVWDVTRINTLTGGDAITARGMHEDEQTFEPSHTLVLATNHRPSVAPNESAFWSRYREIPFTVSFEGREDTGLADRIVTGELPGVLRWLAAGYTEYTHRGLDAPLAVQLADVAAKAEANAFSMFLTTHYIVTGLESDIMPTKSVWAKWSAYRMTDRDAAQCPPNQIQQLKRALVSHDRRLVSGPKREAGATVVGLREAGPADEVPDEDAPVPDEEMTRTGRSPIPLVTCENTTNPDEDDEADENKELAVKAVDTKTQKQDQQECSISVGAAQCESSSASSARQAVVIDIEGPDVTARWDDRAEGYTHLVGLRTATGATDTAGSPGGVRAGNAAAAAIVGASPMVIGHNLISFDLPVLARQFPDAGIDVLAMTRDRRVLDTMVIDATLNPPVHDGRPGFVERAAQAYSLNASCERHGMPGKTDHLPALAAYHGGFDRIPVQDPAYRAYLAGDLDATARLAQALLPGMTDYAWREQRVAAIASVITDTGIMVNKALATQRHAEIAARRVALTEHLVTQYGIPTTKADGTESSNPAATRDGKAAIEAAFRDAGVAPAQLPRTPTGAFATGREGMEELSAAYAGTERVTDLCQVVADMSGLRTVYGTALDTLRGDGACHPGVAFFQASGRWSLTKPGMTVYGKRNGRVVEREIFVPRPGHVLLTADLSQIDARAIAVHSQDPAYMALFEPGTDSHDEVAALIWGEWDRASGHHPMREPAKKCAHSYNYGVGLDTLAKNAKVPLEIVQQFDATMKASFPVLVTWKDWIREQAKSGEPLDNGFGRKLYVDPDRTYTQAPALMGQGTARDLMAETMLRLPDWVARMLRIQVHDEAVYEVPTGQVDEVTAIVHAAMNFEWAPLPGMRPIQVTAEVNKPGVNWMDCYTD
jgi:DNA polymerase-1